MKTQDPKVGAYLAKSKTWKNEISKLRKIALDCDLDEGLKWGTPCYTFQSGNIVLIHTFKEYCALLFFKGALLKDTKKVLFKQTKNTQAARQIRFTNVKEIEKLEKVIKAYIKEAVAIEKAGLKVKFKKTNEFAVAQEFKVKLDNMPALKAAFGALTPGRQRAYLLYFSSAKQSKTRVARVEKCVQQILKGKGLDD